MIAIALALTAAYGVHLAWTAGALGWGGLGPGPVAPRRHRRRGAAQRWLAQAGLDGVRPRQFVAVSSGLAALAGFTTYSALGSPAPALVLAGVAATLPVASSRNRRRRRMEQAQEAWPRMIEEIRILTGSVGRSIPQALFEAGRRAPVELRRAFDAAHREWLVTTDFARTVDLLKAHLADATADAACETLLVAHEVGGADLDRRLEALAEDRQADLQGRRDARAEQAGVRFARRFVLVVPLGMAVAGMSVGNGRSAYREASGQAVVLIAIVLVGACWAWASRLLVIPDEQRVFE